MLICNSLFHKGSKKAGVTPTLAEEDSILI